MNQQAAAANQPDAAEANAAQDELNNKQNNSQADDSAPANDD